MSETKKTQETTEIAKKEPTAAERFAGTIYRQFTAEAGNTPEFTEYERTLAQHLFLKVDAILKDFETKRLDKGGKNLPYEWKNINMTKLAIDAVHRVKLGLDALIPNHIHPVPYFNTRDNRYDLDLRVGYVGKDFYRQENARDKPESIRYELVYTTDNFKPIKKSFNVDCESYEFEITNPFDRGDIIGGFGYIDFGEANKSKNMLVIVSKKDFNKSKGHAQSKTFWDNHPTEMMYKTLVHRVTEKLALDPRSVNAASYSHVEFQENDSEIIAYREIEGNAHNEMIDADVVMNGNGTYVDNTSGVTVNDSTGEVIEEGEEEVENPLYAEPENETPGTGQQSMYSSTPNF